MSTPGPTPARLEELRHRFETAAYDNPNVSVLVTYRPALASDRSDRHAIDPDDIFLRGFLRTDGGLGENVSCTMVNAPPYRGRFNYPSSGEIDWEGIVRESWAEDPRTERPRWWCYSIFRGQAQFDRLDMLATDAGRLILGASAPPSTPANDWMIHLASRAGVLAPHAERSVLLTLPAGLRARTQLIDVRFENAYPEFRHAVTANSAPSWWTVQLGTVFRLSRDVIDETLRGLAQREDDQSVDTLSRQQSGRRLDPEKPKIVAFVRELREKTTPWKEIPDAVFKRFGKRLTSETLRGYLKNG